jgi:hypothetical protein
MGPKKQIDYFIENYPNESDSILNIYEAISPKLHCTCDVFTKTAVRALRAQTVNDDSVETCFIDQQIWLLLGIA